ncbi:zinc ribbon domain-containing protein [Undibacterium squillarum]|uniref:Zinc-ribbon domain-containing protein n=1 Tax=Undibacterium squillarum TaxID=1131567 RepID=A0ABQ2Y471_9BURK|nr:zinc ribbon domain-containing protein [Undibacterium squillarum]GGX53178.1 hypothetical protein GCM10010946_34710 [Undibacterium squillarum]
MALKNCRECGEEVSDKAKVCPHCGINHPVTNIGIGGMIILGVFAMVIYKAVVGTNGASDGSVAPVAIDPKVQAQNEVKLKKWSMEKSGFGTVLVVSGVITNASKFPVKDPVINCTVSARSGTELGRISGTLYEGIAPAEDHRFQRLMIPGLHSQADSVACRVASVEVM